MASGYTLFETPLGACGIAWGQGGIVAASLPASHRALRDRLAAGGRQPADPPAFVIAVIDRIRAVMAGSRDDLADIALDMTDIPAFNRNVYRLIRTLAPGETTTYGALAGRLGDPLLAQAVGKALGANPFPPIVPCHRVLAAGGRTGGFSAAGGVETKMRLLLLEGAAPGGQTLLL